MTADESLESSRILILMRHAKSDWSDGSLSDHDRPLNQRGRRDAPRMADWLKGVDSVPDLILSSTSERTRETAQIMLKQWSESPTVSHTQSLYLAHPKTILETIQDHGDESRCLLVLAHNPGMSYMASTLADKSMDMPTAAAAVFRVRCEWHELRGAGDCELVHFMRPKALDA